MDFLKLVRARYSVRQYQNRPVEPEKVEQLLEAAQAAPTAANCQPVRLLASTPGSGRAQTAGRSGGALRRAPGGGGVRRPEPGVEAAL